jgi:flagellar hook-basal body complex protein FliE
VTLPIDTSFLTSGADWNVGSVDGSAGAGAGAGTGGIAPSGGGSGFGSMLTDQLDKLEGVQNDAAKASQDLATGQATDPEAVVMAVERARLSMQLASTLRSKAVEAVNDVFHTQV